MYYNDNDQIERMNLNINEIQNMESNTTISDRTKTYNLYHLDKKPSFVEFRNKRHAVYSFQSVDPNNNGEYMLVDIYFKAAIKNGEYIPTNKIVTVSVF